jgi:hypothetical protein
MVADFQEHPIEMPQFGLLLGAPTTSAGLLRRFEFVAYEEQLAGAESERIRPNPSVAAAGAVP